MTEPTGELASTADREFAVELAKAAGDLTLRWFANADLAVEAKHDGSPVTEADKAAEKLIRQRIADRFPGDGIIGEEFETVTSRSGRTWVIDPIDGTKSFICGVPLYGTLVSLLDEVGPAIGVAYLPAIGEMVDAGRGLGCRFNGEPTSVSTTASVEHSTVTCSGVSYLGADATTKLAERAGVFRTWGDAYGYALVATGRADAMLDSGLSVWDVAPMNVIIPEAGGAITSWDGESNPQGGDVVATNGVLHAPMRALLAE